MLTRIAPLPDKKSFFLFGPRQTGKSTLINSLIKNKRNVTIDLLNSDVMMMYLREPALFRKEVSYAIEHQEAEIVFVDEIQKTPLLLDEIHSLTSKHPQVQFIVSGSSARKLKRGSANLLAGRLVQRFLHPLVFSEIGETFLPESAMQFGTLPPVYNGTDNENKDFLLSYVNTYLKEEIQAEGIIRNLGGFSRFLEVVAAQNGEMINFSSVARDCGVPSRTVQSYYEILEDTLIGIRIDAWRKSVRKRLLSHPKYYLFDTGVSNAICRRFGAVIDPVLKGRLFEQWIVTETYRYLSYFYPEMRLFYWRTAGGAEVDLLFEAGGKVFAAVEFKMANTVNRTHMRGLLSFSKEYPGTRLYLVCNCKKPYIDETIEILPWKDYLIRLSGKILFPY